MAVIRCDLFSEVLELGTSVSLIVPEKRPPGSPTLYLLHGLSDDDTAWLRRTRVEEYAEQRGLTVVMPQVHRSFYSDEVHGLRYWTYLSEELPRVLDGMFRLAETRENRYVAGLSMGGYGAFKWGLRHPELFAAAASLSGVLGLGARTADGWESDPGMFETIFGSKDMTGTDADIHHLLRGVPADTRPALYLACGTEDFLFDDNEAFIALASELGVPLTTDIGPGDHDWRYWEQQIQNVIDWLPLPSV